MLAKLLLSDTGIFFIFALWILGFMLIDGAMRGKGYFRVLRENLSLLSLPANADRERRKETPYITIILIALNCLFFLGTGDDRESINLIMDNLVWFPRDPAIWNVPVAFVFSFFLHAGWLHLLGNMAFLWVFGSVIERRIGCLLYLKIYLLSGALANLIPWFIYLLMGEPLYGLGASGAITGIMGVYMVRCYYRQMTFPLPILGFLPIAINVKMNAFALIGIYFALDLRGGFTQIIETSGGGTNHLAHISGLLTGIIYAYRIGLHEKGVEERHLELGLGVIEGGTLMSEGMDKAGGTAGAEKSLRIVMTKDPTNPLPWLQLARIKSHTVTTDDARGHYRHAFQLYLHQLRNLRPGEERNRYAAELTEAYREFWGKYQEIVEPEIQYRIAGIIYQQGDIDMASRILEQIASHPDTDHSLREQAHFLCAKMLEEMGLHEAAQGFWTTFRKRFPQSDMYATARMRAE
ncbi:rhomboid family intramembrane serine protease [Trichlorobacter lovleyi]|uniref:rhomboid family intramembrane serine protease n=1 Tax=Trichlorobacter lovleyi TaxID=313985 RepID=UPI00223FEABA|nr:rhomboid family intramembrane serine protease [Trichlorobacter lovleyi]QOX79873.1 rhomboid family intramembrane serine protease [Trichlorobacter lovleyi]